ELFRVIEARRFRLQLLLLAITQLRSLDLLGLEAEEVLALLGLAPALVQQLEVAQCSTPPCVRLLDLGGQWQCIRVRVEDATLLAPAQQRLVLMLAVQVDELPADLTDQRGRARGAIDPRPVAPLGG